MIRPPCRDGRRVDSTSVCRRRRGNGSCSCASGMMPVTIVVTRSDVVIVFGRTLAATGVPVWSTASCSVWSVVDGFQC